MPKKPAQIMVAGQKYKATVMRVVEKDEMNRPLLLKVMRSNETAQLSEDPDANHFLVVFAKVGTV